MCAANLPRLFKLNNQLKFDQAINNIEHEMFANGKVLNEAPTGKCIAVKFDSDIISTEDIASKFKSFGDTIHQNEQTYNAGDSQSIRIQINFAVDFINSSTKHETYQRFRDVNSIKGESVIISATSNRSIFETLVSIYYAAVAFKRISVILDGRRAYLKELLLPMFQAEVIDADLPPKARSTFCTQIIFDSADFQSALNVLATALNDTTSPWKIRSCWIQDTLRTKFMNSFQSLLPNGKQLTDEQKNHLTNVVAATKKLYDITVFQSEDKNSTFLVGATKKHIDSDLFAVVNFFRTRKEVLSLVHATDSTNSVSLWSESISLAYDVADKVKAENVWINSNGLLHPEIPFTFGTDSYKQIYGSKLGIFKFFDVGG